MQIVTAIVGKSDTYVELPWKAFALGAALAALGVVLADAWRPEWVTAARRARDTGDDSRRGGRERARRDVRPPVRAPVPPRARRDLEVRQHAQSLFLTRELFATAARTGVLILVSLFERRIEILPDTGLHGRVSEADWRAVIARMTPQLRESRPFHALAGGARRASRRC